MIPPPDGFRRSKFLILPSAKQSLSQDLGHGDSDWPLANQQVVG